MSEWHRRNLLDLADAVRRCHGRVEDDFPLKQRLAAVLDHANIASKHVDTNAVSVLRVKMQLCAVCRGEALYECDVIEGWSDNCALMKANKG